MLDPTALCGERITVLGAGVSGVSLARLASRLGADVFVSDAGKVDAAVAEVLGADKIDFEAGGHSPRALECDRVLVGSGFPPAAPFIAKIAERGVAVVGELDFVSPYLAGRLIGVTGSNGKTTTTSLLAALLAGAGLKAAAVGNIGSPLAGAAGRDLDFIVAELSSFQLYWANGIGLLGAIVTNLAPDHIDWHGSYENYVAAKAKILSFVSPSGFSIIQERDAPALGALSGSSFALAWQEAAWSRAIILDDETRDARIRHTCPGGAGRHEKLFCFTQTSLLGRHNMENVAMAMGALSILGVAGEGPSVALSGYAPPPHRCAQVAVVGGVSYIDDSKGTNVAATVSALRSLPGPKVVILGGRGKGENYGRLAPALQEQAKWAVLMGEAAHDMASALAANGYDSFTVAAGMEEAVEQASLKAEAGDTVLLSPACTSWDAYANYGERGDHFAELVRLMKTGELS